MSSTSDQAKAAIEMVSGTIDHVEESEEISPRARRAKEFATFERQLGFWASVKLYKRACLWSLYSMILVFNYGIDGVVAGLISSIPAFRKDYGRIMEVSPGMTEYLIPAVWLSIMAGISQAVSAVGAMAAGYIADRIGRRATIGLSCLIAIGGVAGQFFSNGSLAVLVVGKALNGFPMGMWLVLGPTYVSEIAPIRIRGVLAAMTNSMMFMGVFFFTGVVSRIGIGLDKSAYKIPFACQWIIPAAMLATIFVFPESPVWLCRTGKREKAIRMLKRIHGENDATQQDGILAQIEETLQREREERGDDTENFGYLECFNKVNRHRTFTTMWVYTCKYLSGAVLVLGQQAYFYIFAMGWSASKAFNVFLGATATFFVSNFVAWYIAANLKRRPTIIYGQIISGCCLFILGGCAQAGSKGGYIAVVVFMYMWGITYQISMATVGWVVGAELPALRMRSRTQGLANVAYQVTSWIQAFTFPYLFNPDAGNLGGKVGYYYGATTLLGAFGCFLLLPETRNRNTAEIDALYHHKVPIRKFQDTDISKLESKVEI